MKTFSLGQDWVSRVTNSAEPDAPVAGVVGSPRPSAQDLEEFLGYISRTETVREISRRKWLKTTSTSATGRVVERGNALMEFLSARHAAVPAFTMFKGRRPRPERNVMDEVATCAWITHVTDMACQSRPTTQFSPAALNTEFVRALVKLSTNARGPKMALDAIRDIGISVVVESSLPAMSVDGASFHTPQTGPVLALTLRHDRLDNFWFTVFHELGHIRLHLSEPSEDVFIDSDEDEDDAMEAEAEANAFAKDSLVPRDTWLRSEAHRFGNVSSLMQLAKQLGIHPAIVAGRIRYERRQFDMFQDLIGQGQVRETVFSS